MSRKRSAARTEDDMLDEGVQATLPPRVRKSAGDDRDPREPLSEGAVVEGDVESAPAAGNRQTAEDLASRYARALIANQGDVVLALVEVFDISPVEAMARMVELHERARGATRANNSVGNMLERHDISLEVRIARMRQIVFGADDRVALRAIEALNEMDATAKSRRIGTTWESLVKKVRENAAMKLAEKIPRGKKAGV